MPVSGNPPVPGASGPSSSASASKSHGFPVPAWCRTVLIHTTRHWLTFYLALAGGYAGLALAAPMLEMYGWTAWADRLYLLYSFVCHQEPAASYFLFGPEAWIAPGPDEAALAAAPHAYGHATAICQRELAIYGAYFLCGSLYLATGRRGKPAPWVFGLLLSLPMAVDGVSQLMGLRESDWIVRTLTGTAFSVGTAWTLIPRIDDAMRQVGAELRGMAGSDR